MRVCVRVVILLVLLDHMLNISRDIYYMLSLVCVCVCVFAFCVRCFVLFVYSMMLDCFVDTSNDE